VLCVVGRGLCVGPIPRPAESYPLCVSKCDQMRSDGDGIVLVQKCDLYNLQTPNVDISISTGL